MIAKRAIIFEKRLDFFVVIVYNSKATKHMESCPSWSKEHDWKSCKSLKRLRGFESLALRQIKALDLIQVLFYFKRYTLWDSNPERVRNVKKTVRRTVFSDEA